MSDSTPKPTCPHCGSVLDPWQSPDMTTWGGRIQLICFNDECPYYIRGWNWMKEKYNVVASYRYRLDPDTGQSGPIAVWSPTALKNQIVDEEETS
jgi:hypothetical protein